MNRYILFAFAAIIAGCNEGDFTSSSSLSGVSETTTTVNGQTFTAIKGEVIDAFTITSDRTWLLDGGLYVADGGVLTVEKGTTVYASTDGDTPLISVRIGGQIIAEGTADAPIVFTSINSIAGSASPGDWGGIILNGSAPTNLGYFGESEGGAGFYGGESAGDNSGILKYVRIEYAGKILGEENELNGLSLNAVGNGTLLEYIQTYKCSDDGFEFFGGTCNLRYAVSTGNEDDAFDWTFGWSGNGQFWVVDQDSNADNGLEADNNEDNFSATPFSNPILANFTFKSNGGDVGAFLRNGTKGNLYNGIITGFSDAGIAIGDDNVVTKNLSDGTLLISNITAFKTGTSFNGPGIANSNNNNTKNITLSNRLVGSDVSNINPNEINTWFVPTDYRGAIQDNATDWTKGWARNLDGSIRN